VADRTLRAPCPASGVVHADRFDLATGAMRGRLVITDQAETAITVAERETGIGRKPRASAGPHVQRHAQCTTFDLDTTSLVLPQEVIEGGRRRPWNQGMVGQHASITTAFFFC